MYGNFIGKVVECTSSHKGKSKDGRDFEAREYLFEVSGMRPYKFVFRLFKWIDDNPVWPVADEKAEVTCVCTAAVTKEGKWFNTVNCTDYKKIG